MATEPATNTLAVVGAAFREAPTQVRGDLAAFDKGEDSPSAQLLARGYARGIVRIETCSRSEWVLSAPDPKWAAELLRSALVARLPGNLAPQRVMHVKSGFYGAYYLFRMTSGLDSLAEGEAAVARQVLKAFADAHAQGRTDRALNLAWNRLGKMISHKRRLLPPRPGVGVQKLALDALVERGVPASAPYALIGMGQIGQSVNDLFRRQGRAPLGTYGRQTFSEFLRAAERCDVVIVASGAPAAWLDLPPRAGAIVVDLGSPMQVRRAPGWAMITLDDLLARPGCLMPDDEHERLEALVEAETIDFVKTLSAEAPKDALEAMAEKRSQFMHTMLPKLLASIDKPQLARDIRRELYAFTHDLIQKARGEE